MFTLSFLLYSMIFSVYSNNWSELERFLDLDTKAAPCDDFFEHFCSAKQLPELTSSFNNEYKPYLQLLSTKFKAKYSYLKYYVIDKFPEPVEKQIIDEFRQSFTNATASSNFLMEMTKLAKQMDMSIFIDYERFYNTTNQDELESLFKITFDEIFEDLEYSRISYILQTHLDMKNYILSSPKYKAAYKNFYSIVNSTIQLFVEETKKTPWINNMNVLDKFLNEKIALLKDASGLAHELTATLNSRERKHVECNKNSDIGIESLRELYCLYRLNISMPPEIESYKSETQAFNSLGDIYIGELFVLLFLTPENPTTFGITVATLAHEIAHTLFETPDGDAILPYYSTNVQQCVKNQCLQVMKEYTEDTNIPDLEEYGADNIGNYYSYILFKNAIGVENLNRTFVAWSDVTNQQAFFYSMAWYLCGEDTTSKIRVNAVVNMPEFGEAFNCPPDSRMMKTKTETCYAFGPNAPLTRRK